MKRRQTFFRWCFASLLLAAQLPLSNLMAWSIIPQVQTFTLPTGQHVYIVEKHDQPIVTIDTWVQTGSVNETAQNNGVSHFLEHLLFKGTPTHPAGTIDRLLESRGATFNAATSDDFTHFFVTLPSSAFKEALALHADMLLNASIPFSELKQERLVVQEEINRANDNPERQLFTRFLKPLFGTHRYGLDTLGPKENIATIPRYSILNYYHYWYQPQRFYTVIVGDVSAKTVLADIARDFPKPHYSVGPYLPLAKQTPTPPRQQTSEVAVSPSISQAYWVLGWQGPGIRQTRETVALDAAFSALANGRHSRLYRRLVEQQPLATDVNAFNQTEAQAGVLAVSLSCQPKDLPSVRPILEDELKRFKAQGITADELEAFKTQTLKNWRFQNESTEGIASSIGYAVTIGKLNDYSEYVDRVQALTVAEVNSAIQQAFSWPKTTSVLLLPKTNTVIATEKQQLGQWLQDLGNTNPLAKAPVSPETVLSETLPGGTRLLMKPLSDANTVTVKLMAKGGQAGEAKPGIASLAASLLLKGTNSRTAEDLNQLIENQGMSISASPREDVLEITGSAASEDIGELFNVLSDILVNSTFDKAELEKAKSRLKDIIIANRDTPSAQASEMLSLALYPKHPYGDVGERVLQALPDITVEDIQAYMKQSLNPANLVWATTGRFNPDLVRQNIRQVVVALPVVENAPSAAGDVSPIVDSQRIEQVRDSGSATWLLQGWLAPGIQSKDYATLKVINALLGTGMSSRLFVDLREKQGLAYAVNSQFSGTTLGSKFLLSIGTDPKNQAAVESGFNHEIDRLMTEPIPGEELQNAKDKVVGTFALAHETPADQAFFLGYYEALGLGYQFDKTYPRLIQQVTANDVQRVAKAVFSQPHVLTIVKPVSAVPVAKGS